MKAINDTKGHPEGDKTINLLAETLRSQFRKTDIVGRIGGDEFAVFLDGIGEKEKLGPLMDSLIARLAGIRPNEGEPETLNASIGVATGRTGEATFEKLYSMADKALYFVKKNGKRQYAFYSENAE